MNKPSVILMDDHRLFRSGLKFMIEAEGKYSVIGEASNGNELIKLLENRMPDLVIFDVSNPFNDDLDTMRSILSRYPDLRILILSICDEPQNYHALIDSGIRGFLIKDSDNKEFFDAISRILSGETYFSQALLMNIIKENSRTPIILSQREKEVLVLISQGLSNHEIAAYLNLSRRTIERHRTNLLEKTNSKNSISLIIFALKNNLITL